MIVFVDYNYSITLLLQGQRGFLFILMVNKGQYTLTNANSTGCLQFNFQRSQIYAGGGASILISACYLNLPQRSILTMDGREIILPPPNNQEQKDKNAFLWRFP